VKWYSDVFDLVFPNLDKEKASSLWKDQLKKEKKDKKEKKRKEEDSDDED
jgi:Lon-like ATP-dependent protease